MSGKKCLNERGERYDIKQALSIFFSWSVYQRKGSVPLRYSWGWSWWWFGRKSRGGEESNGEMITHEMNWMPLSCLVMRVFSWVSRERKRQVSRGNQEKGSPLLVFISDSFTICLKFSEAGDTTDQTYKKKRQAGRTWCSLNIDIHFSICSMNEREWKYRSTESGEKKKEERNVIIIIVLIKCISGEKVSRCSSSSLPVNSWWDVGLFLSLTVYGYCLEFDSYKRNESAKEDNSEQYSRQTERYQKWLKREMREVPLRTFIERRRLFSDDDDNNGNDCLSFLLSCISIFLPHLTPQS